MVFPFLPPVLGPEGKQTIETMRRLHEFEVTIERSDDLVVIQCDRNWLAFAAYTIPTALGVATFLWTGMPRWIVFGALGALLWMMWWLTAPCTTTIDLPRGTAARTVRLGPGLVVHRSWPLGRWEWVEVRHSFIGYPYYRWPYRVVTQFGGGRRRLSGRVSKRQAAEISGALRGAKLTWGDCRHGK